MNSIEIKQFFWFSHLERIEEKNRPNECGSGEKPREENTWTTTENYPKCSDNKKMQRKPKIQRKMETGKKYVMITVKFLCVCVCVH